MVVKRKAAGPVKKAVSGADAEPKANPRRDLLEAQIVDNASRLFAERGFAGTNLQDVAEATGLTRPALYYYVRSKEDLLSKVLERLSQAPAEALQRIRDDTSLDAPERLRAMAMSMALGQASAPERFRMVLRSEADLPKELASSYDDGRRKVLAVMVAVIEEGMTYGAFRPTNARVAALGVIGMCNWVAFWYRPGSKISPESVAKQLADMAVAAIVDPRAAELSADGPARALELLRQDVDFLAKVLDP